jgi:peptidyl-tRNA hydrolase, PTH1 family
LFAIIGLGNPGSGYAQTRHNIGFRVLAQLVAEYTDASAGLRWQEKFGGLFARLSISGKDCLFILPQKYMNLSGEASVPVLNYFGVSPSDVIVVHDDIDLEPGVLRLKHGGSAGGHRGVANIIEKLGSDQFMRVRVGIGHPKRIAEKGAAECGIESDRNSSGYWDNEKSVADWVLDVPGSEEQVILNEAILCAVKAVGAIIEQGLESAQQMFNGPRVVTG